MIFSQSYAAAFGVWFVLQCLMVFGGLWFLGRAAAHSKILEEKLDDLFDEMNEGK